MSDERYSAQWPFETDAEFRRACVRMWRLIARAANEPGMFALQRSDPAAWWVWVVEAAVQANTPPIPEPETTP